ncbi:MAG TPA: hypothetical protein VMS38_23610 [Pseudorhodoferax sp.]|nr:hypothetical protein [Pseudorhodoferax sp.]
MPDPSCHPLSTVPQATRSQRQARLIRRLRENLFELQCVADPDAAAIDQLMRRLARVRGRRATARA